MAGRKLAVDLVFSSGSKAAKRQVTNSTFEKWQRQFDREYQALSWLRCNLDRDKVHVATLWCEVCKKHERSVQSLKNFSRAWITRSNNQKVSNVVDRATSEVHKASIVRTSVSYSILHSIKIMIMSVQIMYMSVQKVLCSD